jgi:hypothetical protein
MKKSHHALTLEPSTQLLQIWPGTGLTARYAKAAKENSNPAQVQQMRRWVVQVDELDDVHVPSAIVDAIIDKVSRATCFQHFAYCGSLGPLKGHEPQPATAFDPRRRRLSYLPPRRPALSVRQRRRGRTEYFRLPSTTQRRGSYRR